MLAELLLALCASVGGNAIAAIKCADTVFIFAAGSWREAALLFIHLLDDSARIQRIPSGCIANQCFLDYQPRASDRPPSLSRAVDVSRVSATNAEVLQNLFEAKRPFIVEDMVDTWPARERWKSFSYLDAAAGHRQVPVELGSGREELMTLGHLIRAYLIPSCEHCARTSDLQEQPLAGFEVAYMSQHALMDQDPKLRGDIMMPEPWRRAFGPPEQSNVWLGTHGTFSPCHWDVYNNCLAQVQGTKRVLMLAPEDTRYLYADHASVGGAAAQGNMSPVDVEAPNLSKFPEFVNAQLIIAVLMPGDALFIPSGWWHQVRALSPSLSVNFWF